MRAIVQPHADIRSQLREWERLLRRIYPTEPSAALSLWQDFVESLAASGGNLTGWTTFPHPRRPNNYWCRFPPFYLALLEVRRPKWWQFWKRVRIIIAELNFSPGLRG